MAVQFTISKGLQLPISGAPVQDIKDGPEITEVALIGDDYIGMKPTIMVSEGDRVRLGQPVFADKKTEGVVYTAPASGTVTAINRGEKRRFESLVIQVAGDDRESFRSWNSIAEIQPEQARHQLLAAGLWQSFRTRPYNRTPVPGTDPHSIFITAMDTNPLAAEPELIISENAERFSAGVEVVAKLTSGRTYVCTREASRVKLPSDPDVVHAVFGGPHPAGLPGTHIHFLDPVGPNKTVWFIGYQDVIAIGELFTLGQLNSERIVSICGPDAAKPGLYRTRPGAKLSQLLGNQNVARNCRVISGSALSGRNATAGGYLGRFHNQVTLIPEGNQKEFLGWQKPGFDRFSVTKAFLGGWMNPAKFRFNTNLNGSHRAMVPIGIYERVMPLDILPTQLLRALLIGDTEQAQALGCLELDEDDLALCTYVCPGKADYGSVLRKNLATIEKKVDFEWRFDRHV